MSEQTKAPSVPSVESLRKHLDDQSSAAMVFAGNPKINPYLWIARYVRPLKDTLSTLTTATPELAAKVLAVKFAAPVVETKK